MRIEEDNVFAVKASRLAWREWRGEEMIGTGDIRKSYSADKISDDKPIRTPFEWQGSYWTCVSITRAGLKGTVRQEFNAYRLVPCRLFSGAPTSYRDRTATEDRLTAAREDPLGFYHGMAVKYGKNTFLLTGPEAKVVSDEETDGRGSGEKGGVQLSLF